MKKIRMMVMALLVATGFNTTQGAEATTSPHRFVAPECTYAADMAAYYWSGWDLQFSQSYGRDANLWPALIANGSRTTNPQANDLMVLDAWSGSSVGHVGWVHQRYGPWIGIVHTNMKVGVDLFTYGGATFRYAWFRDQGNGSVFCYDNGKTYPLKGFITKK